MATSHGSHEHPTPTTRLTRLLREERHDLAVLLCYILVTGIFSLAVPLAAQALVNTVAAAFSLQQLIVLTLMVLGGLIAAGILRLLQLSLVEVLQQRVFARTALRLGDRIPRIQQSSLANAYAPELMNRFFDVLTIQKAFSKLLLDGVAAALQAAVGLILIAFYNPLLLGLAVLVFASFFAITVGLGYGGLRSSIHESVQKYRVADWLEELARCHTAFKMNAGARFLLKRTDALVMNYIAARRNHFRVIFRQAFANYFFQAIASAGTLSIGGWLVLNRQLTLGQLVAAELIIVAVLSAMDKLIKQAEQVYDLLTALDKVGHISDLPVERSDGRPTPTDRRGAEIICRGVRFRYLEEREVLAGLDLHVLPGSRVSLVGSSGAGKSTLASLFCVLGEPNYGTVEIDGLEVRAADLASLRRVVSLVGDDGAIFAGTLEENVVVGRTELTHEDLRWALDMAGLTDEAARMPDGIRTPMVSGGRNISHGQRQRILIARAVIDRPRLLILDEAFTGIEERTKLRILDRLYAPENPWTIVDISHDAEVVMRSQVVHVLANGTIVESGSPEQLLHSPDAEFCTLFPDMRRLLYGPSSDAAAGTGAPTKRSDAPVLTH